MQFIGIFSRFHRNIALLKSFFCWKGILYSFVLFVHLFIKSLIVDWIWWKCYIIFEISSHSSIKWSIFYSSLRKLFKIIWQKNRSKPGRLPNQFIKIGRYIISWLIDLNVNAIEQLINLLRTNCFIEYHLKMQEPSA